MADIQTETVRGDTGAIRPEPLRPGAKVALILVAVLCLLAVGLSIDMWIESAGLRAEGTGGLALCGEGEVVNCGEVLASRYATWMGIPLAGAGLGTYGLLLMTTAAIALAGSRKTRHTLWAVALTLATLGTLSGLWLLVVQIMIIERICILCDITHACGLVSLILLTAFRPATLPLRFGMGAGGIALTGTLVLVVGQLIYRPNVKPTQVLVDKPATTQPVVDASLGANPAAAAGADAQAAATQSANLYQIKDAAGTVVATLDLDDEIVWGDRSAEQTLLEFMEYGCPECSKQSGHFEQILAENPGWFRLVILLTPPGKKCNPHTSREKPNVCEIAEAALAVHKHAPEKFLETHKTFFKLQSLPLTGAMAWELVKGLCDLDDQTLRQWQDDPELTETLKRYGTIAYTLVANQKAKGLPMMFANGKMIVGAAESAGELRHHITHLIGPPPGKPAEKHDH